MRNDVTVNLPGLKGTLQPYILGKSLQYAPGLTPITDRVLYAAVHVVADPNAANTPNAPVKLDWDATLRYRHHLWSYGLGVAEAMDTAQRGMGLDWTATKDLINYSLIEARSVGGMIACGAGTDQLPEEELHSLDRITEAYEEQCAFIEERGGRVILMASRALAATARTGDDYLKVYSRVLNQVSSPVILHWLGEMFDPKLAGYWGSHEWEEAMAVMLSIIENNQAKIEGMKMSLLDASKEIIMRRQLPADVKMFTGDDFNYPSLIKGDSEGYSHALLGILDVIGPAVAAAVSALQEGNERAYDDILNPTVPLSRRIFEAPTYYYKTGLVFLAYLNGHQEHFRLIGGIERRRSLRHLIQVFQLADKAGLLSNPDLAANRMQSIIDQQTETG